MQPPTVAASCSLEFSSCFSILDPFGTYIYIKKITVGLNNCHKDLCYPLHAPYLDCLLHKQFNGVLLSQRRSCKLCGTASASLLGQLLYLEQTVLLKLLVCCASVTQKPDVPDLVCVCVCVVFPASAQSSGLYPFSCALSLPRTKTLPLS